MKNIFFVRNAFITLLITGLFLCGCDKGNTPAAPTTTESTAPVQSDKPVNNPQTVHMVEKTYDGQTITQIDVDDFPLRGGYR